MAAPAIYEGAVKGGTLFDGMKFWVAQRIPMRSTYIGMITSNGGQVVPLEKLANVMIADHARKDAPPGSYSWKFIAESVKMGRLEKLEDHPAGPPVNAIRPVGSAKLPKGTRVIFTDEDDRVLAQWVKEAERKGLPSKGNLIYQQLQSKNPRHTFQSWRDRWIKHGQYQDRPDLMQGDDDHGPSRLPTSNGSIEHHSDMAQQDRTLELHSQRNTAGRSMQFPRRALVSAHADTSSVHNVSRSNGAHETYSPPSPKKPLKNKPFTKADRDGLLQIYEDIVNIDEENLVEAWEAYAVTKPEHTAQDWYKFWINSVKPLRSLQRKEVVNHKPPDRPPETQSHLRSAMIAPTETPQALEIRYPSAGRPGPGELWLTRAVFETLLENHFGARGLQIDLEPNIRGMRIRLIDLWRIINWPEFGGVAEVNATRQWGDVAQQLGFNDPGSSRLPSEIKEIYDLSLKNFVDAMIEWLPADTNLDPYLLSKEEYMPLEGTAQMSYKGQLRQRILGGSKSIARFSEDQEIPSSPPQRLWSSGKPGHNLVDVPGDHRKISQTPLVTPNKRRRVDKEKDRLIEIPSTPEGLLRLQEQARGSRSPLSDQDTNLARGDADNLYEDDEEGSLTRIALRNLPETSNLKKVFKETHAEPETQDFHFSYHPNRNDSKKTSLWPQKNNPVPYDSMGLPEEITLDDSSTQTDSQQNEAEVQAIVDRYNSLGYPIEIVTQALLATTLHTGDAATVMESLMRGEGIPINIEGVWTEEDDQAVRLPENDEHFQRLLIKHKEDRCVDRRNFLREKDLNRVKRALRRT